MYAKDCSQRRAARDTSPESSTAREYLRVRNRDDAQAPASAATPTWLCRERRGSTTPSFLQVPRNARPHTTDTVIRPRRRPDPNATLCHTRRVRIAKKAAAALRPAAASRHRPPHWPVGGRPNRPLPSPPGTPYPLGGRGIRARHSSSRTCDGRQSSRSTRPPLPGTRMRVCMNQEDLKQGTEPLGLAVPCVSHTAAVAVPRRSAAVPSRPIGSSACESMPVSRHPKLLHDTHRYGDP